MALNGNTDRWKLDLITQHDCLHAGLTHILSLRVKSWRQVLLMKTWHFCQRQQIFYNRRKSWAHVWPLLGAPLVMICFLHCLYCMTFVVSGEKLTTVQQSGQNHHINSSANSRKTTSNDMSTMVPSNCGQEQHYWTGIRGLNVSKKISKGEIKKSGSTHSLLWWQRQQRRRQRGRTERKTRGARRRTKMTAVERTDVAACQEGNLIARCRDDADNNRRMYSHIP